MSVGLVAAPDFKPRVGGVAEHAHQMVTHLGELGERIVVMAPQMEGAAEFDRTCGYTVIRFTAESDKRWASRWSRLSLWRSTLEAAEAVDPDYLVCSRWDPITGSISVLASRVLRIPLLVFAHGTEVGRRSKWGPLRQITMGMADRVVCVSSYTQSLVEKMGLKPDQLAVVTNGFDSRMAERFSRARREDGLSRLEHFFQCGMRVVLTISRLVQRKGIDRVISAMPDVVAAVPNAVYLIGGDGPDRERLEGLRDASPARDSIKFLGGVTESEKLECYQRCDLFVMPNRAERGDVEGFGIVFLEANAFGKPVIGGRSGGALDAIVDGETGLLVDPNDVDEVANGVVRLLEDADEATRLGANGKRRVESDFSWTACAIRFRTVIDEAVARSRKVGERSGVSQGSEDD